MTIRASPVERKPRGGDLWRGRVPCLDVATLAQPGRSHLEQLRVTRTVRLVAIEVWPK